MSPTRELTSPWSHHYVTMYLCQDSFGLNLTRMTFYDGERCPSSFDIIRRRFVLQKFRAVLKYGEITVHFVGSLNVSEESVYVFAFSFFILVCQMVIGTHWLFEIIQLIMADGDAQKIDRKTMTIFPEVTAAASPEQLKEVTPGYKIIEKLPSPRIITSHIPEPLCPPQWFTKNAKVKTCWFLFF